MICLNCENEVMRDYPLCNDCEGSRHFTNRADCRCGACERDRAQPTTMKAYLVTNSFAGRRRVEVVIVGETPKRYRIRAIEGMKMPGRCRWLCAGETALVPKTAVEIEQRQQARAEREALEAIAFEEELKYIYGRPIVTVAA